MSGVNRSNRSVRTDRRITPANAAQAPAAELQEALRHHLHDEHLLRREHEPEQRTHDRRLPLAHEHLRALRAAAARRRDEIANQRHLSLAKNDGLRVLKHEHARVVRARLGRGAPEPPSVNRFFRDSSEDSSEVVASK